MSIVLGPNQYGKAENRVVRIYRDSPRHEIRDLNASSALGLVTVDRVSLAKEVQAASKTLLARADGT